METYVISLGEWLKEKAYRLFVKGMEQRMGTC